MTVFVCQIALLACAVCAWIVGDYVLGGMFSSAAAGMGFGSLLGRYP